jgi:hypothetical protein
LNCWYSNDIRVIYSLPVIEGGSNDQDLVAHGSQILGKRGHGFGHTSNMGQIGIGEHTDFHYSSGSKLKVKG